jgi:hypothetical protein
MYKWQRIIVICIFGIAFAFVEASVVIYLNHALAVDNPHQSTIAFVKPLINLGFISFYPSRTTLVNDADLLKIEKFREAATIIMLLTLSFLSAVQFKSKLGAFFLTFATWDIFYYVFLRIFTGWPTSFTSTDVFFLLPIPWEGPVLTPISISLLLWLIGIYLFEY